MPRAAARQVPRQLRPELESDFARSPALGYEAPEAAGFVRCLAHGFPTPLARWHFHDEYELHVIVATSGKAFVGDWIGPFQPGHVVLCGPRLPHNWISLDLPEGGVAERDLVIQFAHAPIAHAAEQIPELAAALPMLERSRHGIEFFGLEEASRVHWQRVRRAQGIERFAAFCAFLAELAACTDYRLLSNVQLQGEEGDAELDQINAIVDRITGDVAQPLAAADVARDLGMSESRFSRFFRRATGNTFTDFVNRIRVNRACQLLMESDRRVTHICYEVGFANVANFNRRFLEIKGMTPSEFRRQADRRFGGARG
jgi:AraC-like DNA-binding protein